MFHFSLDMGATITQTCSYDIQDRFIYVVITCTVVLTTMKCWFWIHVVVDAYFSKVFGFFLPVSDFLLVEITGFRPIRRRAIGPCRLPRIRDQRPIQALCP